MEILASILLIVFVLLLMPIFFRISFDDGFVVYIRIIFVKIKLYPKKQKKSKKVKKSTPNKRDAPNLTELTRLCKLVLKASKRIIKAITILRLSITVKVASDDPYYTAILFGSVNTLVYNVAALIDSGVKTKNKNLKVYASFEDTQPIVECDIRGYTTLISLLLGLILLAKDVILNTKTQRTM